MNVEGVVQQGGEEDEELMVEEGWGTGDFTDMFWGADDFTEMLPLSLRSSFNSAPLRLILQRGISQWDLPDEILSYCFSFLPLCDVCGVLCTCRYLAHMLIQSNLSCHGEGIVIGSYLINEAPPSFSSSLSTSSLSTISSSSSSTVTLSDTIRDAIFSFLPNYDMSDTSAVVVTTSTRVDISSSSQREEYLNKKTETMEAKLHNLVQTLIIKALPCLNGPPDVALIFGNSKWHKWLPSIESKLEQLLPAYVITLQCATSQIRRPPKTLNVMTSNIMKHHELSNINHHVEMSPIPISEKKMNEGNWSDEDDALMLVFLRIPKYRTKKSSEAMSEDRASELVSSVANIAKICCVASGPSQCGIDYASLFDIATYDSSRTPPW